MSQYRQDRKFSSRRPASHCLQYAEKSQRDNSRRIEMNVPIHDRSMTARSSWSSLRHRVLACRSENPQDARNRSASGTLFRDVECKGEEVLMAQNQTRDFEQPPSPPDLRAGPKANDRNTGEKIERNRHHSPRPPNEFPHQGGRDPDHPLSEPARSLSSR